MTDLIKQAEALEANATVAEHAAKSQHADAARWRAEAAKLREQAREPREWFLDMRGDVVWAVHNRSCECERPAIRVREVRPGYALVKVPTDEELAVAWCGAHVGGKSWSRNFANALGLRESLAGVGVEK